MKKLILAFAFCLILSGLAFAVNDGSWGTSMSSISFTPSKNVYIYWDVDTNNQTYAVGSKHILGNRVFATTSAVNQIYYKEDDSYKGKTPDTIGLTMPSAGASTLSGWSSL